MRLTSSVYLFDTNEIVISLIYTHADGTPEPGELRLSPEEVQAYFDTPISPAGFRATFVQAFITAVQARHPSAQVTG